MSERIVTARVEVIQWINPESGELWWDIDHSEDASLTQIVGLLTIATHEMYRRAMGETA